MVSTFVVFGTEAPSGRPRLAGLLPIAAARSRLARAWLILRDMSGSSVVAAASCAVTTEAPQKRCRRRGRNPTRPVSGPCQRDHNHALVAAEVQRELPDLYSASR